MDISNATLGSAPPAAELLFPTIDLSKLSTTGGIDALAHDLEHAFTEIGFAYVCNHGVPAEVIENALQASSAFFGQPQEVQDELVYSKQGGFRGYIPPRGARMAKVGMAREKDDSHYRAQRQSALIYASENRGTVLEGKDLWPAALGAGFRDAVQAYRAHIQGVATRMLPAFAKALGRDPRSFAQHFSEPVTFLRFNYYPSAERSVAADEDFASAPHSDYGFMTLLLTGSPGLQVRTTSGQWVDMPVRPGHLVLNVGDWLNKWSGSKFIATPHRVVHRALDVARHSVAFFFDPHLHTVDEASGTRFEELICQRLSTNYIMFRDMLEKQKRKHGQGEARPPVSKL
jgi:isopenicillin N synthase-like dioxygenase